MDVGAKATKLPKPIVSLQRVWKTYVKGGNELTSSDGFQIPADDVGSIPSLSVTLADENKEPKKDFTQLDESENIKMFDVLSIPEFGNPVSTRCGVDSETESVVSDYSEMADAVKEHLANVQIVQCSDVDPHRSGPNRFVVQQKIFRELGEDDGDFLRRVRKVNLLSLAQEFADLKKLHSDALPFNLHEERYRDHDETEADDVDEISTDSLSTVDASYSNGQNDAEYDSGWPEDATENSVVRLHCAEVVDGENNSRRGDLCDSFEGEYAVMKSEIGSSEEVIVSEKLFDIRTEQILSSKPPRLINEADLNFSITELQFPATLEAAASSNHVDKMKTYCDNHSSRNNFSQSHGSGRDLAAYGLKRVFEQDLLSQPSGCCNRDVICQKLAMADDDRWSRTKLIDDDDDVLRDDIESDMNLQLCYINEAADDPLYEDDLDNWDQDSSRSDVVEERDLVNQVDRQKMTEFPMTNSPALETGYVRSATELLSRCTSREKMKQMTPAQLQIVANYLHERIEAFNRQLVVSLFERDDLQRIQDSMLVDLEDLIGRASEYTDKIDSKKDNGG